tara:strand:- start:91 stop:1002 length:912 start_codon:yes stop_codon:yes gene_type:complete
MQVWKKKGLIYKCNSIEGLDHYAAVPFVIHYEGDVFRVYYSGRNLMNQSYVSFFDYDLLKNEIIEDTNLVILQPGEIGGFDSAGVVLFQIVQFESKRRLYFSGWSLEKEIPFRFNIGLAQSETNSEDFRKMSKGPIVGQTIFDPYMAGAPYVMYDDGLWKMWYISCVEWKLINKKPKHYYKVMYTESNDGVNWFNERKIAIDFKNDQEFAIARPIVLKEDGIYKMWYSYRGEFYNIGYAESVDGVSWKRLDDLIVLNPSAAGWDSEMICYPFIVKHKGMKYMFYNGNGYGRTGIGLAVLSNFK